MAYGWKRAHPRWSGSTWALRCSVPEQPCKARAGPNPPVHCAASSLAAPIGVGLGPSNMDSVEEAGTAASLDLIIVRLRTLEAADQVRTAPVSLLVVNVRSGVVHLVVGDPSITGFRCGGLKPHVRFADSRESSVDCGICFVGRPTRPFHRVLEHMAAVSLVQECTAPVTLLA